MDDSQFFRYLGWQAAVLLEREGFIAFRELGTANSEPTARPLGNVEASSRIVPSSPAEQLPNIN